eukprot:12929101-Prorocentrum_lima.AAC.1
MDANDGVEESCRSRTGVGVSRCMVCTAVLLGRHARACVWGKWRGEHGGCRRPSMVGARC